MALMCQGKVTQMCFSCVIISRWEILFVNLPYIARVHQDTLFLKSQNLSSLSGVVLYSPLAYTWLAEAQISISSLQHMLVSLAFSPVHFFLNHITNASSLWKLSFSPGVGPNSYWQKVGNKVLLSFKDNKPQGICLVIPGTHSEERQRSNPACHGKHSFRTWHLQLWYL